MSPCAHHPATIYAGRHFNTFLDRLSVSIGLLVFNESGTFPGFGAFSGIKNSRWLPDYQRCFKSPPDEICVWTEAEAAKYLGKSLSASLARAGLWREYKMVFCLPFITTDNLPGVFLAGVNSQPSAEVTEEIMWLTDKIGAGLIGVSQYENVNRQLQQQTALAQQLEERERSRWSFLSMLSHEFKTPLNSIIGFTDLLLSGVEDLPTEEMFEFLRQIKRSSSRQLNMVQDLLLLTQLDSGEFTPRPTHVTLHRLTRQVISNETQKFTKRKISVDLSCSEDTEHFISDGQLIRQLIQNLTNNAIKFSHDGGKILVSIRTASDSENCRTLLWSIKDEGIGIAFKDSKKLFQPFSQINQSLTRRFEGTGLGLYLCKRICEVLGGTISYDSKPGRGSTFTLRLPMDRFTWNDAGFPESPLSEG